LLDFLVTFLCHSNENEKATRNSPSDRPNPLAIMIVVNKADDTYYHVGDGAIVSLVEVGMSCRRKEHFLGPLRTCSKSYTFRNVPSATVFLCRWHTETTGGV
uniref:PPM-type phosphatase domain-containing protein n=1 Tax=Haemonchus placei TaxID=6290 RepID=A0A0N4WE87_HAEPC